MIFLLCREPEIQVQHIVKASLGLVTTGPLAGTGEHQTSSIQPNRNIARVSGKVYLPTNPSCCFLLKSIRPVGNLGIAMKFEVSWSGMAVHCAHGELCLEAQLDDHLEVTSMARCPCESRALRLLHREKDSGGIPSVHSAPPHKA